MGCAFWITSGVGAAPIVLRAGAGCPAVPYVAQGALAAGPGLTARVHASVVHTVLVRPTIAVIYTLRPAAPAQRVTDVVLDARANCAVVLHPAVGVAGAGAGAAELLWVKPTTSFKGVTNVTCAAGANRLVVPDITVCIAATDHRDPARVDAAAPLAGLVTGTIIGIDAL